MQHLARSAWLASAGAAAAAATVRPTVGWAQTAIPVTVVMAPTVDATSFYYAQKADLFARNGLNLTVNVVTSGNLGIVAVVGGAANIGLSNALSVSQAHQKGVPLVLIAGAGLYDTNAPIVRIFVSNDSPIRTAKDLEDHVVAVSGLHDLLALAVRAWIAQQGVDSTRIRFAEMGQGAMLAALDAKRVDAIAQFEPFSSAADASGHARAIARPYDAIAPSFTVTAWFAHRDWLNAHRDAAQRFAQTIRSACEYSNAHLADMVPIVAAGSGLPPDVVQKALKAKNAPVVLPTQLQPLIDAAAKFGELTASFPAREVLYNG
jgi:NitT/TauT family transport system substrate-binding protein